MAPLVLYHSPYSPFSRSVLLLCRYLKVDVEVKALNMMEQEHLSEDFVAKNPQHTVPTIDDDGFYLWESRAILAYIADSRNPTSELVPHVPKTLATMNQRLYYEFGVLTKANSDLIYPIFKGETTEFSDEAIAKVYETFDFIETHYLGGGNEWIAGEEISIADFSYVSVIATMVAFGAEISRFPRLAIWYETCKKTFPSFEECEEGAQAIVGFLGDKITKGF